MNFGSYLGVMRTLDTQGSPLLEVDETIDEPTYVVTTEPQILV
jgi:hypothetical protein